MSDDSNKINVAIIGAGIGGLITAISLIPYENIQIDIYEGSSKPEIIGAGLFLWGTCIEVCKRLGIEERLAAIAPGVQEWSHMYLRRANVKEGKDTGDMVLTRAMGFHRGDLFHKLVEILKESNRATIHYGKRCVGYSSDKNHDLLQSDDEILIHFRDGSVAACHALIGADGIKSVVRKQMLEEMGWKTSDPDVVDSTGLTFTGTVVYRSLIDPVNLGDHPARKAHKIYCGSHKHIVTYPIAGGKYINFVGYSSNPDRYHEWKSGEWTFDEENPEILLKEYSDFEEQVQVLLKTITKTSRWALYDVEPMPHWSHGRVTVLGDAAHAMPPFIGAGGGQGLEDGYILANLLGNPNVARHNIAHALRSYEYIRKERAEKVLHKTREAKRAFQSLEEYADAKKSDVNMNETANGFVNWLWQGKLDLDAEIERGKKEFDRLRAEAFQ